MTTFTSRTSPLKPGDLVAYRDEPGATGKVRIITEPELHARLVEVLAGLPIETIGSVTGPGRSGAVASVYASHMLGVPFIPFGALPPVYLGRLLIIDTARESGKTLRRAERRYRDANPVMAVCFEEPPRVAFWYEARKPQRYRHEWSKADEPGKVPVKYLMRTSERQL